MVTMTPKEHDAVAPFINCKAGRINPRTFVSRSDA